MKRQVSRKAFRERPEEKWNSFIDLIASIPMDEMTPVQRVAFLAWLYSCEVLNGGHGQYFENCSQFDHEEVIDALMTIGATKQARILRKAWDVRMSTHESVSALGNLMNKIDMEFYDCRPEIEAGFLERYLDSNESAFIDWIE
jgi:hypothetical protein